jgi:3'(2'), 5'-bisphosphate nucleotidase
MHYFNAPAVIDLVKAAGAGVMSIYAKYKNGSCADIGLVEKKDQSPLTKADLFCHNALCAGLAELTPNIPVVSEECEASLVHRTPIGKFWLIDPLDGTKEFLARNDEFTINVALISDGQPVWGVVYAPALDELYWGGKTAGAFREVDGRRPEQIQVASRVTPGVNFKVVASKSHLNAETSDFIRRLGSVSLIQAGSSLKLCRVADGAADVYPRLAPTCEWDTAAAQAVVEGAGGFVADTLGNALTYGKPDVLNPSFIASSVPLEALLGND